MTTKLIKKKEKFDIHQMITDKIVTALEQGKVAWQKPWTSSVEGAEAPFNYKTKIKYSGLNWFLLSMTHYSCPEWITAKQLKEKGARFNEGEKPSIVTYSDSLFFEHGEKGKLGKKLTIGKPFNKGQLVNKARRNEIKQIWFDKYYKVFNLEQTTLASESIIYKNKPKKVSRLKKNRMCEKIVKDMQNPPTINREVNSNRAFYRPSADAVTMPNLDTFKNRESFYTTLFHELGHSTGHDTRLKRGLTKQVAFGDKNYAEEELVAEMTASFLGAEVGILNDAQFDNSVAYIQNWLTVLKNNKKLIFKASARAKRAYDYILNK